MGNFASSFPLFSVRPEQSKPRFAWQGVTKKQLWGKPKKCKLKVAHALKLAAQGLHHSQCALGAYYYYRRMAARLGKGKTITATAHKLARLVYAILTQGGEYVEQSQTEYEEKFQDRTLKYLQQKAKTLGFDLVPHAD